MIRNKKLLSLAAILTAITMAIVGVVLVLLYNSAFEQQRARLVDTVKSQASLVEAIAWRNLSLTKQIVDEDPTYDAFETTLSQLREAHRGFAGLGETGEFTLAKRDGDQIVFLLSHRIHDFKPPSTVLMSSPNAIPMKLALSGNSGTVVGLDWRGAKVLAAYEPVEALGSGIVAKIDITEIREPFIRAGLISIIIAVLLTFIGALFLYRAGSHLAAGYLSKQQYYLTKAQEIGSIGTWEIDLVNNRIIWTDENYRVFGVPQGTEVNYTIFLEIIHPDDRDYVNTEWTAAIEGKPYDIEHRILVEGEIRWVREKAEMQHDRRGKLTGAIGVTQDITATKKAEAALEASEARFRRAVMDAPLPIMIHAEDGTVVQVNQMWTKLTGYEHDEISTIDQWTNKAYGKGKDDVVSIIASLFDSDSTDHEGEFEVKTKSGVTRLWDFTSSPIGKLPNGQKLVLSVATDITETKRLLDLESRSQRLETAGVIAGQVAHDFNNLLAPMMAYPDFMREELPKDHSIHEYIDQIEEATHLIADINQQLLTLGRRGHYSLEVVNLNSIVNQAMKELDALNGDITCTTELEPALMNILGGGSQLHRVITNLLSNAVDALQNIGHIIIKTENHYADDVSSSYGRVPKGEYVKLTVSDTGCGMPDDIANKILDPFFTTKTSDKRRGSGLGMSVVDSVIKDHNGFLDMETSSGKGTSFYIYLPITRESINEDEQRVATGGSETILVVDDDIIQRKVTSMILNKLGYNTNAVESGEEAIEFIRGNPQDLIILDMIMPGGIDGSETYQRIREISPSQKAIFVSGFSESSRIEAAQKLGAGAFVKKPLTRKAIAVAVRSELDGRVATAELSS